MSTIIPVEEIPEESLNNLISAFVLREGTDYGEQEVALETKVKQVLLALKSGEALLVFSELDESFDIVSKASMTHMITDEYEGQ